MACSISAMIGNYRGLVCFADRELTRLRKKLRKSKRAAYAKGTMQNLRIQWKSFLFFCIRYDFTFLPASAETLSLYAQCLSESFKAVSSIRNYVSGAKLLHILTETPCPAFSDIELKIALRGIHRLNPHCTQQAAAMTPQILAQIYAILDLRDPVIATMWALFCFCIFTLTRKSNVVVTGKKFDGEKQVRRADVLIGQNCLLVSFRWTKTIQFGQRVLQVPLLAMPQSCLCPVRAYQNMVKLNPASPSDPAFNLKRRNKVTAVPYPFMQKFLKTCVNQIGLDGSKFSSHSFRRGGATWAFKSQVPSELIKVQGDWASQAYMRYLDFSLEQRALVAKQMIHHISLLGI
jgi:hypothetical protein